MKSNRGMEHFASHRRALKYMKSPEELEKLVFPKKFYRGCYDQNRNVKGPLAEIDQWKAFEIYTTYQNSYIHIDYAKCLVNTEVP